MNEKTDIRTVEMVRRIRDRQAVELRGKTDDEIIAYFRRSGKVGKKPARRSARMAKKGKQPATSKKPRR